MSKVKGDEALDEKVDLPKIKKSVAKGQRKRKTNNIGRDLQQVQKKSKDEKIEITTSTHMPEEPVTNQMQIDQESLESTTISDDQIQPLKPLLTHTNISDSNERSKDERIIDASNLFISLI